MSLPKKVHSSQFIVHRLKKLLAINSRLPASHFLVALVAFTILTLIILMAINNHGQNLLKPKDAQASTYFYPKVILIIFNPTIESRASQKLSSVLGWNNPDSLTQQYISDMREASGGTLNYSISQRLEYDDFPSFQDGFDYTDQSYLDCINDNTKCHTSPAVDFAKLFTSYQICSRLNSTGASEVWFFSGPYNGFYEWNVKGPSLNLYEENIPNCGKTVYVMGFNYERTVGEMLHDFGHRTEIILHWRVFNVWANADNVWDNKFDGQRWRYGYPIGDPQPAVQTTGTHCGDVHFPPNSNAHYNVESLLSVSSDCDDWYNYPNLTGKTTNINCTAWGCNERGHNIWWLKHIPQSSGQTNGISNNWWHYVVDWDNSLPKVTAATLNGQPQMTCNSQGKVDVVFSWNKAQATGANANTQWLDLSTLDNNFASGTYVSTSNPPYINSSSYKTGTGKIGPLTAGKTHYWRLNTNFTGNQSNFWLPSERGIFKTPDCAASSSPTPIPTPIPSASPAAGCLGPLKINSLTSPVAPGGQVTVQINSLSNCNGLGIWTKINAQGQSWKSCTVSGSGCLTKHTAPNIFGDYQVFATSDLDKDGQWYETGESDYKTLTVVGSTSSPTPNPSPTPSSTPRPTPTPTPTPNIVPAKLNYPQMSCNSSGNVQTTFTWTKGSGKTIDTQWLDLSLFNNNFAWGTFLGTNNPPYAGNSSYQTGTGKIGPLTAGKTHFWRINTHFYTDSASTWYPSSTGVFTTPTCGR